MPIENLDRLFGKLDKLVENIEGRSAAGAFAAGLMVQAEAQRRTPVDTGNLRGSAFTRRVPEDLTPDGWATVEVGFSADYAVFVHEDMEARHAVGQAKFLESAVYDLRERIVEVIKQHARTNALPGS